jgi:hypothetical protein
MMFVVHILLEDIMSAIFKFKPPGVYWMIIDGIERYFWKNKIPGVFPKKILIHPTSFEKMLHEMPDSVIFNGLRVTNGLEVSPCQLIVSGVLVCADYAIDYPVVVGKYGDIEWL